MAKYSITLTQTAVRTCTVEVDASNEEAARDLAEKKALNAQWGNWEYDFAEISDVEAA